MKNWRGSMLFVPLHSFILLIMALLQEHIVI
jgi:hypothetical protein